ncbi:MAG: hypothetical protein GC192_00750 [Bacteroidetes bacterium]|nr:hypothetical protein [Bacteroidota bacterium]
MKREYIHLTNPFEIATRDSKVKMNTIATDHDSNLEVGIADPDIDALYQLFHPEKNTYQDLMATWVSIKGLSKSKTKSWEDELDEIKNVTIYAWEGKVFAIFPKNTPQALSIFPNNKSPLTAIKYEERLIALDAFHKTLATYPELADLTTEVGLKVAEIKLLRKQQSEYFKRIKQAVSDVEAQRKVLAKLLNNNLSTLKIKFCDEIDKVKLYFDFSLLRRIVNDNDAIFQFSGAVEAGMTFTVVLPEKLTVSANASCTFSNQSEQADLQFFFAANGSASDNTVKMSVATNESVNGTAAEAGWAPGTIFLIVKNMGSVTAEFDGMVIEAVEEGGN